MNNRIEDRVMLKDLIDRYATESDGKWMITEIRAGTY